MFNKLAGLLLLAVLLLTGGCFTPTTVTPPTPISLKVAGSTSAGPLLIELAAAYTQQHPHISLDVQGGGSQLGRRLVESGQIDIGLVSGPPDQPDDTLQRIPVGRDGIAIITHPQNPIVGLSMVELNQIFSGQLLNWQVVAGPPTEVQVVSREDGSGTRVVFESIVMKGQTVTPNAVVMPNSQAVVDFVSKNPNAVGYVSAIFAERAGVNIVSVEGVLPTLASINDTSYPLISEVALLVKTPGSPAVQQFVTFVQSPAGQQIINRRWGRAR